MEHGLDARHARRTSQHDPVHRRYHHHELTFALHLRVHRELHPAALARRGRARQGLAARRRCPATAGSASPTCARSTATCGRTPARSCSSWAASSRRSASGTTSGSLDWHLLERPRARGRPGARPRPQPRLPRRAGALGARLRARPASAGSTPNDAAAQRPRVRCALGDGDAPPLVCVLQPLARSPRHDYRVGLPRRAAAGARCSTPTRRSTAAAASATSAASRPRRVPWHEQPLSAELTLPPLARASGSCPTVTRQDARRPDGGLAGTAVPARADAGTASGTNFSLFSEHAERVELCLFDDDDRETRDRARATAPRINWHCYLPGVGPASATATACTARTSPQRGHRFNPNKLLIDPYAKAIEGPVRLGARRTSLPYVPAPATDADLELDDEDDAAAIPKCVVDRPALRLGGRPAAARRPWNETVIYEVHVKGFTKRHPGVREDLRGTYAGLASRRRRSRTCASSASPRSSCCRSTTSPTSASSHDRGLTNYWGYSLDRLPRAARALRRDRHARRAGARVQGDGQGAPRAPASR